MGDKTNTKQAVHALRQMIFDGDLAPGTDHLEGALAARLGMSRTPVREAALTLEAQGLVTLRPRKGLRIKALAPADMHEIYEVLTELESLAAEGAAKQGYGPQDLAVLARSIVEMEAAVAQGNREGWAGADDQFHGELVRLGRNSRIESIAQMMVDQVRRARAMTLHMRPLPVKSNADHRDVLDAILAGDAVRARRVHHAHRTHAKDMLLALLEAHQVRDL